MFGWGPNWHLWEILQGIASLFVGVLLFLVWLAVILLFVRFLLIATRAAKLYLRNNGVHDGLLPARVAAPTAPAPAASRPTTAPAPATKPTPKPRTPKAP